MLSSMLLLCDRSTKEFSSALECCVGVFVKTSFLFPPNCRDWLEFKTTQTHVKWIMPAVTELWMILGDHMCLKNFFRPSLTYFTLCTLLSPTSTRLHTHGHAYLRTTHHTTHNTPHTQHATHTHRQHATHTHTSTKHELFLYPRNSSALHYNRSTTTSRTSSSKARYLCSYLSKRCMLKHESSIFFQASTNLEGLL